MGKEEGGKGEDRNLLVNHTEVYQTQLIKNLDQSRVPGST
jgi:hypothetical protein